MGNAMFLVAEVVNSIDGPGIKPKSKVAAKCLREAWALMNKAVVRNVIGIQGE